MKRQLNFKYEKERFRGQSPEPQRTISRPWNLMTLPSWISRLLGIEDPFPSISPFLNGMSLNYYYMYVPSLYCRSKGLVFGFTGLQSERNCVPGWAIPRASPIYTNLNDFNKIWSIWVHKADNISIRFWYPAAECYCNKYLQNMEATLELGSSRNWENFEQSKGLGCLA